MPKYFLWQYLYEAKYLEYFSFLIATSGQETIIALLTFANCLPKNIFFLKAKAA
jgi:hypothetical protein